MKNEKKNTYHLLTIEKLKKQINELCAENKELSRQIEVYKRSLSSKEEIISDIVPRIECALAAYQEASNDAREAKYFFKKAISDVEIQKLNNTKRIDRLLGRYK